MSGKREARGGKGKAALLAFSLAPFPLFLLPPPSLPCSLPSWTVVLSGDADGYLAPCGCTSPQEGGMTRRATALKGAGQRVLLDNGGLGGGSVLPKQNRLKAETAAKALDRAHVDAANLTARDAGLQLGVALSLVRLSKGRLVSTSLRPSDTNPLLPWREAGPFLIGGASEDAKRLADALRESPVEPVGAAHRLAEEAAARNLAPVMLFDGDHAAAAALARAEPALRLVTYRSASRPSSRLERIGACALATPGERGKGIVSLAWQDGAFGTVEYQPLGPTVPDDPDATKLYREYLERVADSDLLERSPHVSPRGFAGNARCASCHAEAAKAWRASAHHHALATLEGKGHGRDPDCVPCHVVGQDAALVAYVSRAKTPNLADVGCESCHGAGAAHAAAPKRARLPKVGERACLPCHNPENSPHFDFATYWPKIRHGRGQSAGRPPLSRR